MKLNKFETALRARFATPQDALRCLGIDETILNDDIRSKQMKRARDQEASTVEDILEMIEGLSEEEKLELMYHLNGEGEGEDRRIGGRDRRRARDAEWDTEGPPKVGPTEAVGGLERDREAQDRRRRSMGQDAARPGAREDFFSRFPGAARIKLV